MYIFKNTYIYIYMKISLDLWYIVYWWEILKLINGEWMWNMYIGITTNAQVKVAWWRSGWREMVKMQPMWLQLMKESITMRFPHTSITVTRSRLMTVIIGTNTLFFNLSNKYLLHLEILPPGIIVKSQYIGLYNFYRYVILKEVNYFAIFIWSCLYVVIKPVQVRL